MIIGDPSLVPRRTCFVLVPTGRPGKTIKVYHDWKEHGSVFDTGLQISAVVYVPASSITAQLVRSHAKLALCARLNICQTTLR
jgi:hypothetical protein